MKRTLLFFLIVILAVSCKKETTKVSETQNPKTEKIFDSESVGEEEEKFLMTELFRFFLKLEKKLRILY